jgi:O-antigen/teichoic acid export membrane protein
MSEKSVRIFDRLKSLPFLGGSFRQNILKVAGGTAVGQALYFLGSPILTRLYEPADFGRFAVYTAILTIVMISSSLRYELAIPIARDSRDAFTLAVLSALSLGVICLLLSALSAFLYGPLKASVGRTEAIVYCFLFPLSALGGGLYKIFNFYAIRVHAYSSIATTRIVQCLTQLVVQITGGALKYGLPGLVVGDAFGRIAGVRYLAMVVRKILPERPWSGLVPRMRSLGREYWMYPLLSTPSSIVNMSALQLPAILLNFWYGSAIAGYFSFSQTILGAPSSLISQAVAQVFTGEIAKRGVDPELLLPLYKATAKKLFLVGLLPTVPWLICGSWLIPLLFGGNWQHAGLYVQILSLSFLIQFFAAPISQVLIYLNRQGAMLIWDIVRILLSIACLGLPRLVPNGDVIAVTSYTICMIGCYLVLYWMGLLALGKAVTLKNSLQAKAELAPSPGG